MTRLLLLCALLCPWSSYADISLHQLFADGAVLQRNTPIKLKGNTSTNTPIQVYLDDKPLGTATIQQGQWSFILDPMPAGGPHTLTLVSDNELSRHDWYFGDVFLASGQSNMELPMRRVEEAYPLDVAQANYPLIREFTVPDTYRFDDENQDYEQGEWLQATAPHIRQLSAVAFYFARSLYHEHGVPIGIVNASLGGSPIEAWMREEILAPYPDLIAEGKKYADKALQQSVKSADRARQDAWYQNLHQQDQGLKNTPWYSSALDDSEWQVITLPADLPEAKSGFAGVWWLRKTFVLEHEPDHDLTLRLGRIVDADEAYINGQQVGNTTYMYPPRRYHVPQALLKKGENHITVRVTSNGGNSGFVLDKPYFIGDEQARLSLSGEWRYKIAAEVPPLASQTFIRWKPMGLYNAMIAPASEYPLTGILWYQGESNAGSPDNYDDKLKAMITDWRNQWHQPDLPFFIVQLSNFMSAQALPVESQWASLRNKQLKASELPNTASIVTIDIGEWNDVHPVNKKAVGERLALAANHIAYQQGNEYVGPRLSKIQRENNELVLTFSHTQGQLTASNPMDHSFAIASENGAYQWANVKLIGNQVRLSHPDITAPKHVRYAWADNPQAGLYSAKGLPATPFEASLPAPAQ